MNAIIFHKLYGDVVLNDILETLKEDGFEYPIAFPHSLKVMIREKDKYLKMDEDAAKAKDPEREAKHNERVLYEGESLIKALVFKRPDAVIAQKKDQEKWGTGVSRV